MSSVGCDLHRSTGLHEKLAASGAKRLPHEVAVEWPRSSSEATRQHPVRVLLVEDSPLIRKHLVALLEDSDGVSVSGEVDTESAAIAALGSDTFDAAVIDLQLREGSGFGVLKHLRDHHPQLLTVVLTNSNTPAMRARSLALGAHHFLDKSSEFDRVAELLEALR